MSSDPSVPDGRAVAENIDSKDLVFGRTVVPVANRNKAPKKGELGFEYAEHCFIGDAITLTLANGGKIAASDYRFRLKDQLSLTYGQINGLAGEFYGSYDPISDGKNEQDQSAYWSYWWLYEPSESIGSEPVIYRTRNFPFFTVYHHVDILGLNELLFSFPPVLEIRHCVLRTSVQHAC
ncbi:hypothetical protein F5146DRAFT_761862 [Armillaria mellea]|nr:hypothetical protein F5146DRAFT_761862 [Armillaria mellea]